LGSANVGRESIEANRGGGEEESAVKFYKRKEIVVFRI